MTSITNSLLKRGCKLSECFCIQYEMASLPSSCGMFEYKLETSKVVRVELSYIFSGILFKKSISSLRKFKLLIFFKNG